MADVVLSCLRLLLPCGMAIFPLNLYTATSGEALWVVPMGMNM